jgi:hypothetical protein
MEFNLKLGSKFTAKEVVDEELVLHDVIEDNSGDRWAIGLCAEGVPYTVHEGDIDSVAVPVYLPKKGKK